MDITDIGLLVGLTIGLTEVIKRLLALSDDRSNRFVPAISLILGISFSLFVSGAGTDQLVTGVLVGLSASGLFSGIKSASGK